MAGYSGAPLWKKLSIAPGDRVLLDGAPAAFALPELPSSVLVHRRPGACQYQIIVCFCPDLARLRRRFATLHLLTSPAGALWIAWPKRSSGVATDLTEDIVREHALASGRVDVKVCAIDETWSGLKNVIRLADRDALGHR